MDKQLCMKQQVGLKKVAIEPWLDRDCYEHKLSIFRITHHLEANTTVELVELSEPYEWELKQMHDK